MFLLAWAKGEFEELSEEQQEQFREHEALQMKGMFEQELRDEEKLRCQSIAEGLGLEKATRKANRDWIKKLDNMLQVLRIGHKSTQAQCFHMAASWGTPMPRSGIRARAMQQ